MRAQIIAVAFAMMAISTATAVATVAWEIKLWPLAPGSSGGVGEASTVPPVQAGDLLVVNPIGNGPVFAVNLSSKTLLWGKSFDGVEAISVVPSSNTVVITAQDFTFAYDLISGHQLWVSDLLQAQSTPLVHNDLLVFANQAPDGSNSAILTGITAINARSGRVVYNAFNGTFLGAVISISEDKGAFVNAGTGEFVVFDLPSGGRIWAVGSNPAIAPISFVAAGEDHVVVANTTAALDRELVILDANTGKVLSRAKNANGAGSNSYSARIANGVLYVVLFNGAVNAIDLRTGQTKWMLPIGASSFASAMLYLTASHVVATNFSLENQGPTALTIGRLSDGALLSQNIVPTNTEGSVVVVNGKVIVPNLQGLLEFSLATGQLVFRNENLPLYGNSALSVINGEVATITATAIEGLSF